ncbi:MAG: biotin synthase BioB [Candidatus Omnitrophica bacterium]|nr:biotin synthase BioB [Candidatus Omnitrophota bacterium]
MVKYILKITERVLSGRGISRGEAAELYSDKITLSDLMWMANRVREAFKGNKIELCSVVNAKSGFCPEDCKFCAQSSRHKTDIQTYPLLDEKDIVKAAQSARANKASCFGIVTSGKGVRGKSEIVTIAGALREISASMPGLTRSASLGILDKGALSRLKKAGLERFHHNLETSARYFPKICSTHTYNERLRTIERAKEAGLKLCSGGIFGLGETRRDRIDLAFLLGDLDVDSVPLNFLHPIKGTPLENRPPMTPREILRTIAIYRMILPKKDIKVCGGRVVNLRGLQCMMFFAGSSGMMIGNYLTQPGQDPAADMQMIRDLGLRVK